ncbi:MAG: GIY-YIG nuclease family protein [Bacteroidota bacterium]
MINFIAAFFYCTMYYTYILNSVSLGKYYIGCTSNPVERLKKHNAQHAGFTSVASDWTLVYKEVFMTKPEALQREKQIKAWKSKKMIAALIKQSPAG